MFRSNHFAYNQIFEVTMPLLTSSKIIMLTRFKYYNKLLIKWVEFDLTTFFKRELLWVAYCSEVDNNHTFFRNYRGICTCDTSWYICLYRWIDMGIKIFQRNSSFLNDFPIASSVCCNSNFQFFQKYSSWKIHSYRKSNFDFCVIKAYFWDCIHVCRLISCRSRNRYFII